MSAGKVLVVDDELEVRLVLADFLASRGYEVTQAQSGAEALRLLDRTQPDVVLLDVFMPGIDGMETLRRIVAAHPSLPVIMVTGNVDVEVTRKALEMGAADYVPKPFDLQYLEQAVSIQVDAARDR
jgi:two-component system nitrogen regulation response regulator NtrX